VCVCVCLFFFFSSRDRKMVYQYTIGFNTAEELSKLPVFASCPTFVKKLENVGRKIMFQETVSPEDAAKMQKLLDEIDAKTALREGISIEKVREGHKKRGEQISKAIEKKKRKTGITKPFHLRFEWERNRLYFIFQKVATDGNGKMKFC